MNNSDKTPNSLSEIMYAHVDDKPKDFGSSIVKERMYPASSVVDIAEEYATLKLKELQSIKEIKFNEMFMVEGKKYMVVPPRDVRHLEMTNDHNHIVLQLKEIE